MQTGETGHYVGRDGIPTDIDFLEHMVSTCGLLERRMRHVFSLMHSKWFKLRQHSDEVDMYMAAVQDHIRAAQKMHVDDLRTLEALNADPNIERAEPLYAVYRNLFLGKWLSNAPFSATQDFNVVEHSEDDAGIIDTCKQVLDTTAILLRLGSKVITHGYDSILHMLLSHEDSASETFSKFIMFLDRTMRFYKALTDFSDISFRHVHVSPLIAIPPPSHVTKGGRGDLVS